VEPPFGPATIRELIPHRYPFLLVDRIDEIEPGIRAIGVKNVSQNEPFFQGHFPDYPVMPGVLVVEAMAQVGAVGVLGLEEYRGRLALFAGIDGARFRRQVIPGDVLTMEVEILRLKGRAGRGMGTARVGSERVCEAELLFVFVERVEEE
jgi:3-hydroxyacyl-[acyl-carrier-protein] dehydratase